MPLEYDQTAVRALFAVEGKGWTRELSGLLNNVLADPNNSTAKDQLFALEPHRRGRIPVVLVHGTASSPFRWADMVNDLLEDQEIRKHYEFWFFTYNTGNPIPISANVLRHSLEDAVQSLGGVQADPALGRMVVIGHSQGGLLTKLISIDSGTKLWDAISDKPVDELNLKPETKVLLKEALFVHPLPFVETVIFIATPHGGSYQASLTVVGLFRRLVTLPVTVASQCRHPGQCRGGFEAAKGPPHLQQPQRHVPWQPDVARNVTATIDNDRLVVDNVRNFNWRSDQDFEQRWEQRSYDLSQLQNVDLILSYWSGEAIAHLIVSFGFADGRRLDFSIETRKERGEEYSTIAGFFKQYELVIIAADERDIVRVRSNVRGEDVRIIACECPRICAAVATGVRG